MPLNVHEFGQLALRLGELEDFLQDQRQYAKAVNHPADAAVLEEALARAINVHALAQLFVISDN